MTDIVDVLKVNSQYVKEECWEYGNMCEQALSEIEKLRAENEALKKAKEWQPMSIAPKDGVIIQLLCKHDAGYWQTVGLQNMRGEWVTNTDFKTCYPIGWHPTIESIPNSAIMRPKGKRHE